MTMAGPWNINIHYDALLDARVPPETQRVLDVGTGDGFLAARLAERIRTVIAVDIDGPVLQRARNRFTRAPVTWLHHDVMDVTFAPDASTRWSLTRHCTTWTTPQPPCIAWARC
jgi:protein-L-isoaspartate O-methyltransferase